MQLQYQALQVSKVHWGSFSENGDGLNIWGTGKVNVYKFHLVYCVRSNTHDVHLLVTPSTALQLIHRLHQHEGI